MSRFRRLLACLLLVCLAVLPSRADLMKLKDDPHLESKVTIVELHPDLGHVLKVFAKATGRTFELSENLKDHRPALGGWSFRETPVHIIMRVVAKVELQDGNWEKTVTGYRLVATKSLSKVTPPSKPPESPKPLSPIYDDPRLKIHMALVGADIQFRDILTKVEKATGVPLFVAAGLEDHDPQYGSIQFTDVPAWLILRMVAEQKMENGYWEKSADGYRLTGTSLAPRPKEGPGGDSLFWYGITGFAILSLLEIVFSLICYRALRAKRGVSATNGLQAKAVGVSGQTNDQQEVTLASTSTGRS